MFVARAAEREPNFETGVLAEQLCVLGDLHREFAELLRRWQPAQQISNVLYEAEIEHAIGFVEYGNFDLV